MKRIPGKIISTLLAVALTLSLAVAASAAEVGADVAGHALETAPEDGKTYIVKLSSENYIFRTVTLGSGAAPAAESGRGGPLRFTSAPSSSRWP